MSVSRYRHKFTLDSKWRPPVDPFESDPFKIHSYNFRYADRPSLPLANSQQNMNSQGFLNECQTFFYNQGFSNTNNLNAVRHPVDKRLSNLTKFQEYRRRKFLNQTGSNKIHDLPQIRANSSSVNNESCTNNILNLNYSKNNAKAMEDVFTQKLNNSNLCFLANLGNSLYKNMTHACAASDMKPEYSKRSVLSHNESQTSPKILSTSSHTITNFQPSLNSGCEININIKGLKNSSPHENVNVKIETDSIHRKLNVPGTSGQVRSSNNFVFDKRLSTFSSLANKSKTDRQGQLTAIYSSPNFTKSSRIVSHKSTARIPSLIPCQTWNCRENGLNLFKNNLTGQKSLIQRVKDGLSVYDTKVAGTSWSRNNLRHKFYNASRSKLPSSKRNGSRFSLPAKAQSNNRLPLNININVFTDKLKLLNV